MDIIKFKSLDSTNKYLKKNYKKLNNYQVIYTENQTQGIGRKDNNWYANKDSLTFSFIIKDNIQPSLISLLPIYMATIIHKVIYNYNKKCLIKWPNDLYINDKKIAGLLIESIYQDKLQAIIVGVGINLNNQLLPNEIKDKATSLKLETNKTYQQLKILEKILKLFKDNINDLINNPKEIINYYNNYHLLNEKVISYYERNNKKIGKCLKIDNNGQLIVESNSKIISLISGEIEKISTN